MAIEVLLEQDPPWVSQGGPESDIVVRSQCNLARNFSDYPFPKQCANGEKQAVENRVLSALDSLNLLSAGAYYSLPNLAPHERLFLAERQLITQTLLEASGPRGVYVASDQRFCIMVNGADHICLRAVLPGLQLEEAWAQLNLADDTLNGVLDFAYDAQRGYLTSHFDALGTGLKASALLHVPALEAANALGVWASKLAKKNQQDLHGVALHIPSGSELPEELLNERCMPGEMEGAVLCDPAESAGHFRLLANTASLGRQEAEIVFQVRRVAQQLATAERTARDRLSQENELAFRDRVGRARGLAGGAYLLDYAEAVRWLSAMRLGIERKLDSKLSLERVNGLLLTAQPAHLMLMRHAQADALAAERAALFREACGMD